MLEKLIFEKNIWSTTRLKSSFEGNKNLLILHLIRKYVNIEEGK